ncbi:Dynein heavy chain family protein [Tritrichomonas foetus]|uniref:Dynein heavy chain family protein n=1 Tax=Tritrichomonas foetus TaxID=1144522 RepID=A0A1J4JM71_9EUKA|nr:Dynein heavy chain family protein [Tritrichomonas foetus]|eukprot:OHT00199.1 Dynein heavy chain family protein [Tritrichomonas foetus]
MDLLKKFHIEETEIVVPKRPKTPMKRPVTSARQMRGLFKPSNIDHELQTFDVVNPAPDHGDTMLRTQNPCLLAIKTKATKMKSARKKTVTARPKTALNPSAAQLMPSLLTNQKLAQLREPGEGTVQTYQKHIENEKLSIDFPEDPLAYFSKRKDGRGHRFIYLIHKGDKRSPFFNPYELIKVPFAEITPEYFTMSANGVTHIHPDGNTENFSLDRWAKESSNFMTLKKFKLFKFYFIWKPFKIWKNFVMRQRYNQLTDKVMKFSIINNFVFYQTALQFIKETPDNIIKKYLLSFNTQKKYTLEEFRKAEAENRELLDNNFQEYLNKIVDALVQLDIDIRDPARLVVQDSDFSEIKRRNPNLGQLKVLERKKYAESLRRNDVVKKEIIAFCDFIRLADTLIIESLSSSCYECWSMAEENVASDMASIFEIEVSFSNDGKVVFYPSLDELIKTTQNSLHESLDHLNTLPRLLMAPKLRLRLRENIPNLGQLFENGPSFSDFIRCNSSISQIEEHIVNIITSSYHDAEVISQVFLDFYQIYQTGLNWDAKRYLHERGGNEPAIDLFTIEDGCPYLSFDPAKELTADFNKVRSDISRFQKDEEKLAKFRACTVRGALYIDSRQLRATLAPIPSKCLSDMHAILKDITQKKQEMITSIIKSCGRKFKREPTSLEFYVNYCDFIDRTQRLTPFLATEITFIDEMQGIFQLFPGIKVDPTEESVTPLHSNFASFKHDIQAAIDIKDLISDKYLFVLQQELRRYDRKLQKYHDIVTSYPTSISLTDADNLLPATLKLKGKIINLEPKIQELLRCEKILNIHLNDFAIYGSVKVDADLMENIYTDVAEWKSIYKIVSTIALVSIDMPQFTERILKLAEDVNKIHQSLTNPNPLVDELKIKLEGITPYLDSLQLLSSGRMQLHHWNKLFELCGQPNAYYQQIKIEELLQLGILKEKDIIISITSTSQGESQLEADFNALLAHWEDVTLPLLDSQIKSEDSLLLGSLDATFKDIADTQIQIYNMLQIKYVQGIRDQVLKLSSDLENIAQILTAWEVFQSNWLVIAPVFSSDELKSLLPQQTSKFIMVKRRWVSLIKHTIESITLFKVCSFPALLEMLTENNKTLEIILSSLIKYIDTKRELLPRLYLLSNDEVLSLISTNDFSVFNQHISKIFMNIRGFDFRANDGDAETKYSSVAVQDFSRLKVFGIINEIGESMAFDNTIHCEGSFDTWIPNIFNEVHKSLRSNLATSIAKYQSGNMSDWVMAFNTHISILTLQVAFARDMEECFHNIDNNSRALPNFENVVQQRIRDMCATMASPLASNELLKLSSVISLLNYHVQKIRLLSEKFSHYSQAINWSNHIRLVFNIGNSSLYVNFGENQVEHGYEFFGSELQFIHTPSSERCIKNICESMINNKFPLLFGSHGIGKKQLMTYIAANYGRFIYFAPSFPDYSFDLITQLFMGAASTGCWLCLNNLHNQSHTNLSFIYEIMRNISIAQNSGGTRFNLNGKIVELQKTCRFFVTSDASFFDSTNVPPQLRTLLKPVSYAAPDLRLIAEIKLISLGFKSTKHLSVKIISLLSTISETFDYLCVKQQSKILLLLLDNAHENLRQLMHSKGAAFVNYYESSRTTEEYVVARAFHREFIRNIHENHIESFYQLLYSTFRLFNNIDEFKDHLLHSNCFYDEQVEALIVEELKKLTTNKYYIKQATNLISLCRHYPCVFIVGEPHSGKTYITELLATVLEKLSKNPEITNKFPNIKPVRSFDIYQNSDTANGIFGTLIEDQSLGRVQLSGQLNTFLSNLNKFASTHIGFVRFNGPLTQPFLSNLLEIISGGGKGKCRLSTLDTFIFSTKLRFIVETESLENVSPSLFSICGILLMKSQGKPCEKYLPSKILHGFDEIALETTQKLFINEIMPQIAEQVLNTPNYIYLNNRNLNLSGGKELILESLSHKCLEYAICYIQQMYIDKSDLNQIRNSLIISFFTIFSNIIESKELNTFEQWIRTTFSLTIPNEWTGFNVPDHFWETYPRPSLQSLKYYKGNFIPVDLTHLKDKKPYFRRLDRIISTKFIDDVSIVTAQFIPKLQQAQIHARNTQNIFLFGPKGCGKTHFLHFFLSQNPEVIPVLIPSGPTATSSSMLNFIHLHSSAAKKKYFMLPETKIFALIFENVDPENLTVVEFVRMIASSSKAPKVSPKDPKYLDLIELRNYFIIVTSNCIEKFSARFLSCFNPIHLTEPSNSTKKYIFMEVSNYFGLPNDFSERAFSIIDATAPKGFNVFQPLQILSFLDEKGSKSDKAQLNLTLTLLNEMNFGYFHLKNRSAQELTKFENLFNSLFASDIESEAFNIFNKKKEMHTTSILLTNDMKTFNVQVEEQSYEQLTNEFSSRLASYNRKSHCKLKFTFSKQLVSQLLLLQRAISYPGGSCFLFGIPGSNRKSITRFISNKLEFKFVDLDLNPFKATVKDTLYECITLGTNYVLFMRLTNDNHNDVNMLINLIVNHDFTPFLSDDELYDIYLKNSKLQSQNQDQNLLSFVSISDIFRQKLHVVLSIDDTNNPFRDNKYPSIYRIRFEISSVADLENIASISLSNTEEILKLPEKLPNLLTKIHFYVKESIPQLPINRFYDLLDEFNTKLKVSKENIVYKHQQIDIALKFFHKANEEKVKTENRLDQLKPEIDKIDNAAHELEVKFEEKKDIISKRSNELQEEEHLKMAEINQLADELTQFRGELSIAETQVETHLEKVNALQEKDIKVIQLTAEQPSPMYKAFFELLCIFVENPPKYETYGLALATNINLVSTLTNRIAYKNIPQDILPNIKQSFATNNFNHDDMETIAPGLGVLFDWINSIYIYNTTKIKIQNHQVDLDDKTNAYQKYMKETASERESIQKLAAELENEEALISQSVAERSNLKKEFTELQTKLRNINALFKNTPKLIAKWNHDSSQFNDDLKLVIGNTIVYASYMVYGGMLNNAQKTELMSFISIEMGKVFITSTNDSFMYYVASQLEVNGEEIDKAQHSSHETTRDFHHLRAIRRTPLIIDPDRIVYSFLCNQINKDKLVKISAISSSLKEKVIEAMQLGQTLVLTDVNWMNPLLESILIAMLSQNKDEVEVSITGTDVRLLSEFRLYMFTSHRSISKIPIDLLSRVGIIDVSNSAGSTANESISGAFVNFFDPDMLPRVVSVSSAETHYRVEMVKYEKSTFEHISQIETKSKEDESYDFLQDEELFGELLKAKECFFTVMNVTIDFNRIKNEHAMTVEPFLEHIDFCDTIWLAVSRYLPRAAPDYVLPFERFLSLVKTGISSSGVKPGLIQPEGHTQLRNSLMNVLMRGILPSMSFEEAIFLMFTATFLMGKKEDKYTDDDFDIIANHIVEEYNAGVEANYIDSSSDIFEQLKFANIIDFYQCFNMFLSSNFSPDYASFLPIFPIESFFSGSSMTPVIIMMKDGVDVITLLEHFVMMRNRMDSFELYPLYDDEETLQNAYKNITSATSHGTWIAIQYDKPSKRVARCIADIYSYLTSGATVTNNFRLVILTHTIKYLPVDLLIASVRMNIEDYPSIRHQMIQVYQHHSTSIRSSTNAKLMKKMSYVIILLYAMINFSTFINPLGLYQHSFRISEITVKEVIDYLRSMIDAHVMTDLPIRNIRETIQENMFGIGCTDTFDRRKIRSLVYSLITPEMAEDNFTFVDSTSDECDIWTIPPDAPISNYSHLIERLPVFTTCDVLLMSRSTSEPVRNWNLSRWIAKPFLKFVDPQPILYTHVDSQIEHLRGVLPNKIDISTKKVDNPMMSYLLTEIVAFNKAIEVILISFIEQPIDVIEDISNHITPKLWREAVGYNGTKNLNKFTTILSEKELFYKKWLKDGKAPYFVDARYLRNIKGLLYAFFHQTTLEKNQTVDSMTYEFSFTNIEVPNSISLRNIYLTGGNFDKSLRKLIKVNLNTDPIIPMPSLCCTVVKRTSKVVRAFQCPLFISMPMQDFILDCQKERIDGEIRNFVWYIPIPSETTDKQCITEGTFLICHVPDIFE